MSELIVSGVVSAYKYLDISTNGVMSSYLTHRLETAADYITNGAWKKLWRKTQEKMQGKTIEKEPNIEFIDEILEKTKLKTNDDLIELWSRVLAKALQGDCNIRREYFNALEELDPYDVLVLNIAMDKKYHLFMERTQLQGQGSYNRSDIQEKIRKFLSDEYNISDQEEIFLSVKKLIKLDIFVNASTTVYFKLTTFGEKLKELLSV